MPVEPLFSNYEHEIYAAGMLGGRIQLGRMLVGPRQERQLGPALTPDPRPATIGFDGKP